MSKMKSVDVEDDEPSWDVDLLDVCGLPMTALLTFITIPCLTAAQVANRVSGWSIKQLSAWLLVLFAATTALAIAVDRFDGPGLVLLTQWTGVLSVPLGVATHLLCVQWQWTLFPTLFVALIAYLRSETRRHFDIDGDCLEDVYVSFNCTICVLHQLSVQWRQHDDSHTPELQALRSRHADTLPAYTYTDV
ncbi:hypothetical protein PINS_up009638 [Pythium insidiosum]|nr:hypothetical protein PINS_up009638 [Pythium insidiosum]